MEWIEKLPGGQMQIHLRDTPEPILVSLRLAPVRDRKLKALRSRAVAGAASIPTRVIRLREPVPQLSNDIFSRSEVRQPRPTFSAAPDQKGRP